MKTMEEFLKVTREIADLNKRVQDAQKIPERLMNEAKELVVGNKYDRYHATKEQEALFKEVKALMAEREFARGEAERDVKLAEIASQAEGIRAILPRLAANLAIELGEFARSIAPEDRQ